MRIHTFYESLYSSSECCASFEIGLDLRGILRIIARQLIIEVSVTLINRRNILIIVECPSPAELIAFLNSFLDFLSHNVDSLGLSERLPGRGGSLCLHSRHLVDTLLVCSVQTISVEDFPTVGLF